MSCCGGRNSGLEKAGLVRLRYFGKIFPYILKGKSTGKSYRFRARGSEVLVDKRDVDAMEYMESGKFRGPI